MRFTLGNHLGMSCQIFGVTCQIFGEFSSKIPYNTISGLERLEPLLKKLWNFQEYSGKRIMSSTNSSIITEIT